MLEGVCIHKKVKFEGDKFRVVKTQVRNIYDDTVQFLSKELEKLNIQDGNYDPNQLLHSIFTVKR